MGQRCRRKLGHFAGLSPAVHIGASCALQKRQPRWRFFMVMTQLGCIARRELPASHSRPDLGAKRWALKVWQPRGLPSPRGRVTHMDVENAASRSGPPSPAPRPNSWPGCNPGMGCQPHYLARISSGLPGHVCRNARTAPYRRPDFGASFSPRPARGVCIAKIRGAD